MALWHKTALKHCFMNSAHYVSVRLKWLGLWGARSSLYGILSGK
ncbi:hypothetical protein AcetOrient_orf01814 [Acetobacter orientalis]|uniref:Uncharacterized protein n=1 Tax=Acetobacter orientalis TaxID=146474 RepID=A0A2Z5ZFV8_9PROT|nr:hypothetical protein AcetOrient_orf01814 [Acetobacter orientalis]